MSLEFPSPNRTKLKVCDDASWCRIAILKRCPHHSPGVGKNSTLSNVNLHGSHNAPDDQGPTVGVPLD